MRKAFSKENEKHEHYRIGFGKRLFDVLFSIAALIFLSPFLLLIALAIKLESKGPVIYKASRVGTGFDLFTFYKFRTMYKDADKQVGKLSEMNEYLKAFKKGDDFMNKVTLDIKLDKETRIYTEDLAYISPLLDGYNLDFSINGHIKGTASDLKIDSLYFAFADNTILSTSLTVKGLPDINNTEFDVKINKLSTSKSDLNKIKLPPFDDKSKLSIPAEIGLLGIINYNGTLKGSLSKIQNTGTLTTAIGNLTTNAKIDYDTVTSKIKFDLNLDAQTVGYPPMPSLRFTINNKAANRKMMNIFLWIKKIDSVKLVFG